MIILMLSFEFPPLIVGGLGMVCYGLARALTKLQIQINLVLPVEKACYFPMQKPEDTDTPSPVFLDHESSVVGDPVLLGSGLFHSLGLRRQHGLYSLGYPYSIQSVPHEWRSPWLKADGAWCDNYDSPGDVWDSDSLEGSAMEHGSWERRGGVFETMKTYEELVRKVCRVSDFDIIHAHDWVTYPAAVESRTLSGKPLLVHIHSTEYDRSPSSPDPRICSIEKQGLHEADLIAAVSSFHAESLTKMYGVPEEKIRVVHNGIQAASPDGVSDPVSRGKRWGRIISEPLVLFLGRITEQKGAMHFLKAAGKVHRKVPEARFVMAGEGDQTPEILEKADQLGLRDRLSMTGFLDRDGVARMLSSADVLLFPSISDPFGISPLEAMSYGVPVVLSKRSGVSEVVQNVIKCDAWNIDAMASAVVELIRNPEKRRVLGKKAVQEARKLGWTPAALRLRDIYHELSGILTNREKTHK